MQCASPCDRDHQTQRTTVTSQPLNGSVWATKRDERKPTCCTVVAWTSLLASCCLNDERKKTTEMNEYTNSPIATAAAAAAHANTVQEAGISFRPANSTQMLVACGTCSWKCSISGQWHRNVLYFGFCRTIFRSLTTTQAHTPHTSKANRMQLPSNVWLCALNCWNVEWSYFNAMLFWKSEIGFFWSEKKLVNSIRTNFRQSRENRYFQTDGLLVLGESLFSQGYPSIEVRKTSLIVNSFRVIKLFDFFEWDPSVPKPFELMRGWRQGALSTASFQPFASANHYYQLRALNTRFPCVVTEQVLCTWLVCTYMRLLMGLIKWVVSLNFEKPRTI